MVALDRTGKGEASLTGIGLIGLGRHGSRYATHLLTDPIPGARLTAVCRRNRDQGASFADRHGLRFHEDYRDLIADPSVHAVVVVTPPALTPQICLEAVRARKPILIEKPLACTGPAAKEMAEAAEAAGVPLMTAQTLRFDGAVLALQAELPKAGRCRYVMLTNRIEPKSDGAGEARHYGGRGVLLEIGIHLIDLVRFLACEEVSEVRCEMERPAPNEPEVRALVMLKTPSQVSGVLDVSRVSAGRATRVEWIGEDSQIIADWARHRLTHVRAGGMIEERSVEPNPTVLAALRAFADAVGRGSAMPISGRDGQRAVEIADACYESAESGRWVRVVS
jgi:predicted dehydrogenase